MITLPPGWELPTSILDRIGDTVGRQRAILEEGHMLLLLHKLPERNNSQRTGIYFWRTPDGVWKHTKRGSGLQALKEHLNSYNEAIEKLDQIQDQASTALEYLNLLETISPINRASLHLYETLQKAREGLPQVKELINLRDTAYEISRSADLVYNDTRNGLECATARGAEEQAAASNAMSVTAHRLNILVAIFFPLTAIASIFGMNYLPRGFEVLEKPAFFWGVIGGSVTAGLIAAFALAKPGISKPKPHDKTNPHR